METPRAKRSRGNPKGTIERREIDGFVIAGDLIYIAHPTVLEDEPERIIRVFRHAQRFGVDLNFELRHLIKGSLHLIDDQVINSPEANRSFLSILRAAGEVHFTLALMHEHGVLERFVPEFGGLTCLVQHEYYHRYTADVHTLNTIRTLDLIFSGKSQYARKYGAALRDTAEPTLLYLMLFLHDIGKRKSIEGHSEHGADMAAAVLERMQVGSGDRKVVDFIIRHHLEMARFWQHYDIEDSLTGQKFAAFASSPDLLRYLYVHTYCDAEGTAANLWNSYKDMLHTVLYQSAQEHMGVVRDGAPTEETDSLTQKEIRSLLPELSEEEIAAHFERLAERYFRQSDRNEIALHIRMINRFLSQVAASQSFDALIPAVEWADDLNLSMTVVNIVTWDRPGLFSRLAGAFSLAGLNIISSKAYSRTDHITIDTFHVCEPRGGVVADESVRAQFQKHLDSVLLKRINPLSEILLRADRQSRPNYVKPPSRLSAPIPPEVRVYRDETLNRTIVEVHATDQIGLLYRLAREIFKHGFDIDFARISTEKGVAVDTFYVEPWRHMEDAEISDLEGLEDALRAIVTPMEPAEVTR